MSETHEGGTRGGTRVATAAEIDWLLELAAAEGWNPGTDDAAAFRTADPDGFLVALDGERPVAGISVVRQDADHGFLGLYLCHPDARGRGHGWRVWQAGLAHLGDRAVGLDGVVEQQANYRRSGFAFAWRNVRFAGPCRLENAGERAASPPPSIRSAGAADTATLVAFDRQVGGVDRTRFLEGWFGDTATRRTRLAERDGRVVGLGTVRECREHAKVGPLLADTADVARELLRALALAVPGRDIVLDVPEVNEAGVALARAGGLAPVFETARMYRGEAPTVDTGRLYGVCTLELG